MIFLSYARVDGDFTDWLYGELGEQGLEVWVDRFRIPAGAPWDTEVQAALGRADTVLVVLTPAAVGSRHVLNEIDFAVEEGKTVIPLLVAPCTVPLQLRRLHCVDFKVDRQRGLEALMRFLRGPGQWEPSQPSDRRGAPVPPVGRGPSADGQVDRASSWRTIVSGRLRPGILWDLPKFLGWYLLRVAGLLFLIFTFSVLLGIGLDVVDEGKPTVVLPFLGALVALVLAFKLSFSLLRDRFRKKPHS